MRLTSMITLLVAIPALSNGETIGHVTRDYFGDIFTLGDCEPGSCDREGRRAAQIPGERCRCQCAPSHYTFREDMRQCIKDVGECPVAMFVRPFAVERIPLVFLPMTGQLVYPGAHLTVSGIARMAASRHLSCNVKTSLVMTSHGWQPIRTPSHIFGVYYDGNKTFLQWLGDDEDRRRLQQHLVLIRLNCEGEVSNGTFEPCAALRIGWAPGLEPEIAETTSNKNNYIIVGLCLGILGLIYVGAVLIYLKVRKGRRRGSRQGLAPSQGTVESGDEDDRAHSQVRSAYINNLVQEAELTSHKSSIKAGSKADSGTNSATVHQTSETSPTSSANNSHGSNSDKAQGAAGSSEDFLPSQTQPPSQEFFVRIRGMISAAKNRLNSFRYKPTLLVIPEDDYFYQDFKERDIEMTQDRKSTGRFARKGTSKGNNNKVESIHGSHLGAAMLEAKLAPPLPPPRQLKPKSKKRAPSPPGGRNTLAEMSVPSSSSKISVRDDTEETKDYGGPSTSADSYSKFDLFRMDLYEKINRMRETGRDNCPNSAENDIPVLDTVDSRRTSSSPNDKTQDFVVHLETKEEEYQTVRKEENPNTSSGKISRRQLLHKLEIEEADIIPDNYMEIKRHQTPHSMFVDTDDQDEEDEWVSQTSSVHDDTFKSSKVSTPTLGVKKPLSNHSIHAINSHGQGRKSNKRSSRNSKKHQKHDDDSSDGSDATEASLSGDSLNSSFRKPSKSPVSIKSKGSHRSVEELSVISASSMITASTAIKEIDDYDIDGDDDDDEGDETQDDDSRLSTDLDPEEFSLDESEHPSLEEYLQLSSQVAKKLSERTVPVFSGTSQREKNVLSQFMKDFRSTIGRLRAAEEAKPKSSRSTSPGADNWTLKKEEKRAKVTRKVSIFKRNPLKSHKNEELLVEGDHNNRNNYYDINGMNSETEDTMSITSSVPSSINSKSGKSKYKNRTPEIVPANKMTNGVETTVIAITNNISQRNNIENRDSSVLKGGASVSRAGKGLSPPLPPPKPRLDQLKLKADSCVRTANHHGTSPNHVTENGGVKVTEIAKSFKPNQNEAVKSTKVPPRYIRSPSIESDSISIANSDMTEDSLNTPIHKDGSEEENQDEVSEDETGVIDRCLAQLADSVIQPPDDCSLNRYLNQLGTVLAAREDCPLDQCLNKLASNMNANRATKGFNVSQHLPLTAWEHVCVDRTSDRSTPTSDKSSTSRGSRSSQEHLRKKTLTKAKHHHHHHHRSSECKHGTNGDVKHVQEHPQNIQNNHLSNGQLPTQITNGEETYTTRILVEKQNKKDCGSGCSRVTSASEDEDSHASSLGSSRKSTLCETGSDPSSTDMEGHRKKKPVVRRSKKGLNGTCRQHIQNSRITKGDRGSLRKQTPPSRNTSTPRSSSSDVTVIQLDGDSPDHVTNVESSNTFVTLINVDSSDCSNSAEEK